MSKYGVFSGTYFPVNSPNAGKYGPGKTPYLDPFHAVVMYGKFHNLILFLHLFAGDVFWQLDK